MYKVYYADGTTYTGDPYYAPVLGVLVIVEEDQLHGRRIIQNADYYCWENRGEGFQWWESDFVGLVDYLISPGPKRVLIGRLVPNNVQDEVLVRACNDPDFPPKTAYTDRHRRKV